jgi:hypothetical protein
MKFVLAEAFSDVVVPWPEQSRLAVKLLKPRMLFV